MKKRRELTAAIAAEIKRIALDSPDLHQDQIGAKVDQNQGRVSEVLNGHRYADVDPA